MKRQFLWLCLAAAAPAIAGCEPQSSAPPATAGSPQKPVTNPTSVIQAQTDIKDTGANEPTAAEPAATILENRDVPTVAAEPKPAEKPKPAESAVTRPKADREPTRPGDPEKITFDDLILGMQADMVYRPFMLTDRAKELEGKRVRLTGEMYGGSFTGTTKATAFVILRNKECKYGPGGQADHVADVKMKEGNTARFTSGTVRVEGTLRISPLNDDKDGNTKHIYVLEDAVLK